MASYAAETMWKTTPRLTIAQLQQHPDRVQERMPSGTQSRLTRAKSVSPKKERKKEAVRSRLPMKSMRPRASVGWCYSLLLFFLVDFLEERKAQGCSLYRCIFLVYVLLARSSAFAKRLERRSMRYSSSFSQWSIGLGLGNVKNVWQRQTRAFGHDQGTISVFEF